MLDRAFYRSADYKSLIESAERTLVVGRRGTGKSALVYRLTTEWNKLERTSIVQLAPEEDQIASLRERLSRFGDGFTHARAASKIAWRYALLMEVTENLAVFGKAASALTPLLREHLARWRRPYAGVSAKLRNTLQALSDQQLSAADRLGDLAQKLQLSRLTSDVKELMSGVNRKVIFLLDRLDEGFEPDALGTAIIAGLTQAAIDTRSHLPECKVYVFLRDNIHRAIAQLDPDYSSNIEGQVLRLHWDEYNLFNLVCDRLRAAFNLDIEENRKLWNRCTAKGLQGQDGFRKCLQLTLYRPRDVISLLNNAFLCARSQERGEIVDDDLEAAAKEISENRYNDLQKEYEKILPGVAELTRAFRGTEPEQSLEQARSCMASVLSVDTHPAEAQRAFRILDTPEAATRALYSVGFLGLREETTGRFIFCHDGKNPDRALGEIDRVLIHPCYWMALDLARKAIGADEAQEIYDEYDIEVNSDAPKVRAANLGRHMSELNQIPEGKECAQRFEEWCLKAIRIVFSAGLRNIALHPNAAAVQQRDIVASNSGDSPPWRRVLNDYDSRQVLFEVKNYQNPTQGDFRQIATYMTAPYGRIAFLVTRDADLNPRKGLELDWIRELYYTQQNRLLVVKLTGKFLSNLLSKLRNPQKHDPAEHAINGLLDTYERNYLGLPSTRKQKR
ncbi:MAG: ATP-binding protein [Phycisphaerales bacterium]|nr:ATP-binding protein [Phycisphaerales bacterium]